ncbi:regulatory protein RecX [Peptostreptococcaceae bacterium AGR-M142]
MEDKKKSFNKAKNYALYILNFRDYTKKQMKDKLKTKEYEEDIVDEVIKFLLEYKLLNDDNLGRRMTRDKSKLNRYGKNKIKQYLQNKGIERNLAKEIVEDEIADEKEYENAYYNGVKKYKKVKDDPKAYEKVARFLSYKGFEYSVIKKVLNELFKRD